MANEITQSIKYRRENPPSPSVSESSHATGQYDELPPVLSPLSPISPDTLNLVFGRESSRCDVKNLLGDIQRQESRGDDVTVAANTPKGPVGLGVSKSTTTSADKSRLEPTATRPSSTSNINGQKAKTTDTASTILNRLGSHSRFSGLQQVLQADLQFSPSAAVPSSLLPPSAQSLASQKIPISSRAAMLHVIFMRLQTLFPASIAALKDFYHLQSTSMETLRFNQLCMATNTPWLKPSINHYFDLEHHSLIDNIEYRLECLGYGTGSTTHGLASDQQPLPTPPPAHSKAPMTPTKPVLSHVYSQVPTYTMPLALSSPSYLIPHPVSSPTYSVPQGLSTPPFLAPMPSIRSPSNSTHWFSSPAKDSFVYTSTPVFPQPPVFQAAPEKHTPNLNRTPMNKPLSVVAVRVMQNWYDRNTEHPYPSHDTCAVMAKAGSITVEQVKKWFANKRLRNGHTKPIKEIARRRKLPLDAASESEAKKLCSEN